MKLLWIIFDEAFEDQVLEALRGQGVEHFTLLRGALGQGRHSEPRWGTHVWPGHNDILMVFLDEATLERLRPTLQQLRERLKGRGFKTLVWDASEAL